MDNKEISYRKQRPDLFFRDGRPKKKAMLCEKESFYQIMNTLMQFFLYKEFPFS